MIIETKYDIGQVVWMPRVREQWHDEKIVVNGYEYSRSWCDLISFAKKKRIVSIAINLNHEIEYRCSDLDIVDPFPGKYSEQDLKFETEQDALTFAQNWASVNKTEFFGHIPQ